MSSRIPNLGDRLVQTVAGRIAKQAERREKLRLEALDALGKFVENRAKAQDKLVETLSQINVKAAPKTGFKLLWSSNQKRINQEFWRANQRLSEMIRLLLKEQKKEGREMVKLMRLMLEQTNHRTLDDDGV